MMTSRAFGKWSGLGVFISLLVVLAIWLPAGSGQRDADIALRQRFDHWQKLDTQGREIGNRQGPWSCVLDRRTGLVWENKSNDEGVHHGDWTYTWMDSGAWAQRASALSQTPQGSCSKLRHCNTAALVEYANRQHWCGFSDWRVPELHELAGLLDTSYAAPQPLVCPCFLAHTARSSYWSNSSDRYRRRQGLNFLSGEISTLPEHASLYLRLVRGPSSAGSALTPVTSQQ